MAKASVKTKITKETKVVEVEKIDSIELSLSLEEAAIIFSLVGNVGGGGKIRETTSGIYYAIQPHLGGASGYGIYNGKLLESCDFNMDKVNEIVSKVVDKTY